jgi:hypothetical protein
MNAARAWAVIAAFACAGAGQAAPQGVPPGEQILVHAKAVFRAHPRPPYVVYTLVRSDRHLGVPDFPNSYTLKIWCRNADRAALIRRMWNGSTYGGLSGDTIAFDGYVDPGPPTADIFERALYARASEPGAPSPLPTALKQIGSVSTTRDYDYSVGAYTREGPDWHLRLEARRDPLRNRIDDLWIDAVTYEVKRMRLRDHLYLGLTGQSIADEFDVRFDPRAGFPLIATIHGETEGDEFETDYTFRDVSFPETLPDWYFEPKTYGVHRNEMPS